MKIGLQLYTTRQYGSLSSQLELAAECGFTAVESIGFEGRSLEETINILKSTNLDVLSAHFDFEEFEERFEEILLFLKAFDCKNTVMPWLEEYQRPGSETEWETFAGKLTTWSKRLWENNQCILAYHNHDYEFIRYGDKSVLDILMQAPGNEKLHWQPDVGWIVRAGENPAHWLQKYADRIVSIHAKDVRFDPETDRWQWQNIGEGILDWDVIITELSRKKPAICFVEHDNTNDHRTTLLTGKNYLARYQHSAQINSDITKGRNP